VGWLLDCERTLCHSDEPKLLKRQTVAQTRKGVASGLPDIARWGGASTVLHGAQAESGITQRGHVPEAGPTGPPRP